MQTNQLYLGSLSSLAKGLLCFCLMLTSVFVSAQVTTSSISGRVLDAAGEGLLGATVRATHVPSGAVYGAVTNESGRYVLPAVRVGGPFSVTVTFTGFESQTKDGLSTSLGTATNVNFSLRDNSATLSEVVVTADRNDIFSNNRTGAAQTFDNKSITAIPIIGARTITSVTKYNPNGNGRTFGGQDSRLNNFTIDGSVFNNGFGLGNDAIAGGRTGTTPISLDAIEELQVNIAPYDVRQSGFVGAGINAVTKSGTNDFKGSAYYNFSNNDTTFFNGTKAKEKKVAIGKFDERVVGLTLGGPIIKNKLHFFISGETQERIQPATEYVADGSSVAGIKTRVKKADLEEVSKLLKDKFGYETGAYENFDDPTKSTKFLTRLDWSVNERHKATLRYTHHNSEDYVVISNSNSAGWGNRRSSVEAMSFENSGYLLQDNTRSIVAELNSTFSDKISNSFIVGFDKQIEDRGYKSKIFPTIDILDGNSRTYISTGMDPFTPQNLLNYSTFHITNNISYYKGRHTLTGGIHYENYKSNNSFFPASNSVYVFKTLDDFRKAVNNPGDTSVQLQLFQHRYSALPGGATPFQVLKVNSVDVYGQDEFQISNRLTVTAGLRVGLISFGETALANPKIDTLAFRGLDGQRNLKLSTAQLPDTKLLWQPRLGFNLDVMGDKKTQVRGGTGIFTGRPPFVWLSNQIGNNGVLTGFISTQNTKNYPFTDNVNQYTPATPTLPSSVEINVTDPNYRFPQVWKTNLAVDQKIGRFIASLELLNNQNINAARYYNSNMELDTAKFSGVDTRPMFPGIDKTNTTANGNQLNAVTRVHDNVVNNIVLTNTNEGYYRAATIKLEHPRQNGVYGYVAYTHSVTKDLMSPGSTAAGSWTGSRSINGNNNIDLSFSDNDIPQRIVALLNYRINYGGKIGGATEISLGYVGARSARSTYNIAGDMNGDGVAGNDLLFVPQKGSDLSWDPLTIINGPGDTVRLDATAQAAAFDKFIDQDSYLSTRRGQYAERNGLLFPWLHQIDLGIMQEFGVMVKGKRNAFQLRFDVLNFGNLLNSDWGVGNVLNTGSPLTYRNTTAGVPKYRLATQVDEATNKRIPLTRTFTSRASTDDVWRGQLSLRYYFNQ